MPLFGAAHRLRAPTLQEAFRRTTVCRAQGNSGGSTRAGAVKTVSVKR